VVTALVILGSCPERPAALPSGSGLLFWQGAHQITKVDRLFNRCVDGSRDVFYGAARRIRAGGKCQQG